MDVVSQPSSARPHTTDSEPHPMKYFDENVEARSILDEVNQFREKSVPLLQLRSCKLERGIWSELTEERSVYTVRRLNLDYTNLKGKVEGLAKWVVHREVEELSLIFTEMQNEDLQSFRGELEKAKKERAIHLHTLCLMHVGLDQEKCAILAQILNLLPCVQELDITNCDLTDDAVKTFSENISNGKGIKRLYLAKNENIKENGMAEVGKLSKKCETEMLDVSYCDLTDSRLKKLTENQDTIKNLVLEGNADLSTDGLCHHLAEWKRLEKVDVRKCWLVQKDVEALEGKLGENCLITHDVRIKETASASGRLKEADVGKEKAEAQKDDQMKLQPTVQGVY